MSTRHIPTASARAQLAQLLAGATDEKLAGFSVESLSRTNTTPRAEIQAMLYDEQQRRRRRAGA